MSRVIGQEGEELALKFLQEKGYKLVERNFTTRLGEIDLIMKEEETLVFVEVKYYGPTNYADAHLSLTSSKKSKLRKTINVYLARLNKEIPARFDVVIITKDNSGNNIEHFEGVEL